MRGYRTFARQEARMSRAFRLLDLCYVVALLYVCAVALDPTLPAAAPAGLAWFAAPGSPATIAVLLGLPLAHFALRRLTGRAPLPGPPLVVIAAMAASAVVLGMSAYWHCHGEQAPAFAPLAWTLALFVGNVENPFGAAASGPCASLSMPVALEIARLLAIVTTLTAALAAALELFRSQLDRIAIWRARQLTVVVGIDDETVSMLRAIARTKSPAATVVVLTGDTDTDAARAAHQLGAKLRVVDLLDHEAVSRLRIWWRLDRLYLLSADPMENIKRFDCIDAAVATAGNEHPRMPLTVRIDDPWQAEVWRRSFLTHTDSWVADAVGRYEVTAAKLVRHLTARMPEPTTVVLCGLTPLTYALISELAQVHRELQLYAKPGVTAPTDVVIFARRAQSFVDDHHIRQARMAPDGTALPVSARDADPTVDALASYLRGTDPRRHALILGDPVMETLGTRLASRFPTLRVYLASTASTSLLDISIIGHLYAFPVDMELEPDAPQDVWERAAELIHEHYSAGSTRPSRRWADLDPFVKQSNRRQLLNTLSIVETYAGHTWNSLEEPEPATPLPGDFAGLEPLAQLKILGYDESTVTAMVQAEHEDWRRYHQDAGWRYAEHRDDTHRRHDKLLPWPDLVARHPEFVRDAQRSLATTLINLRALGYRSVPKESAAQQWSRYRRRGEVTAEQRAQAWTWTTSTGEVMHARAGDWLVADDTGDTRSVAADVFPATHERIGPGRYRRTGTVLARRATPGEIVTTLEGEVIARDGDWIVQGPHGERWPVPDDRFQDGYEQLTSRDEALI
ncbi:RyR domain-containing protein [Mycobacterium sp. GA-2829]|uniref:RyR domain-containing protein n=1 Tax=Mycobacterium sp. GA-2829 TaxID=1772283 RepID=UPI0012F858FC|nr:RyR domain-containing protein [Mycobacterium sp. GA-2829]